MMFQFTEANICSRFCWTPQRVINRYYRLSIYRDLVWTLDISRSNIARYWTQCERKPKLCSDHELTKDTSYLALTGEQWGVFYEFFGKKIPRYIGSTMQSNATKMVQLCCIINAIKPLTCAVLYTVQFRHNAVNFLRHTLKRHPIGRRMGCLSWAQSLIPVLLCVMSCYNGAGYAGNPTEFAHTSIYPVLDCCSYMITCCRTIEP